MAYGFADESGLRPSSGSRDLPQGLDLLFCSGIPLSCACHTYGTARLTGPLRWCRGRNRDLERYAGHVRLDAHDHSHMTERAKHVTGFLRSLRAVRRFSARAIPDEVVLDILE